MVEFNEFPKFLEESGNIKITNRTKKFISLRPICGSKKEVTIPLSLSKNLAYFVGVITGDGYLASIRHRFGLHKANRQYLSTIYVPLAKNLFSLGVKIRNGKRSYHLFTRNKAIWLMLNKVFNIPKGRKSRIVRMPRIIKQASNEIKKSYLAGLFDTDGGRRRGGYGFTTASEWMFKDTLELLRKLGFNPQSDCWVNKKYNRMYYGWKVAKKEETEFFQQIPLKNRKKFGEHAGIPKRSKGYVLNS